MPANIRSRYKRGAVVGGNYYDNLNRIWQAAESRSGIGSGAWTVSYGQDRRGNLSSTSSGISAPAGMPGAAGDFIAASNRLVTGPYDSEGNLLSRLGSPVMNYDSANRLVSAQPSGLATISYAYDGKGRRIKQTRSGVSTVWFLAV